MPKHNPKIDTVVEAKDHSHYHRSDRNRFFSEEKKSDCHSQNVHVEVNIDQKDDCTTSCFAAIAKCFGKGS